MKVFVIKKKPFLYKLGARIFKWLIISNKVAEYERLGKVLTYKDQGFQGLSYKWIWEEDMNSMNGGSK